MSDFTDLLLPFGQDEQGRMVSVNMVERGAACHCICPQCQGSLVARKGEIRTHHFAHAGDPCGSGALETSLHKMSKQLVCDAGKIWLPEIRVCWPPVWTPRAFMLNRCAAKADWFDGVPSLEKRMGDIQPDVTLTTEARSVALELYVTHAVSGEKRAKVQAAKLDMVEIDLSSHPRTFEMSVLRDYVLKDAPRFWVYSSIEIEAQAAIRHEWITENDRREKARVAEIERVQRARDFAVARRADEARIAEELRRRELEAQQWLEEEVAAAQAEVAARQERAHERSVGMARGLLRAAMMRPSRITGHLTPGCFCAECNGTDWRAVSGGWACARCASIETAVAA